MSRSTKENFQPLSARNSKLPVPRGSDVKRKRRNISSPKGTGKPSVSKTPKSAGRVPLGSLNTDEKKSVKARRNAFSEGTTPSKEQTALLPVRCTQRKVLSSLNDQEDIHFEADQSALQSILNETGIETMPAGGASGPYARHTLASTSLQRASIYVPHKKMDSNAFKKLCDEFSKGGTHQQPVKRSSALQATGLHAGNQCSRRMTTDTQFSPKRRCVEKRLNKDEVHLSRNDILSTPHGLKSQSHLTSYGQGTGPHLEQKVGTLDVLTEERTEELTSTCTDSGSNDENINITTGMSKIVRKDKVTSNIPSDPKTPLRVLKNEVVCISKEPNHNTSGDKITSDIRCDTKTPLRVLKDEGLSTGKELRYDMNTGCLVGLTGIQACPMPKFGEAEASLTPRVLREKKVVEMLTPVRVIKPSNVQSPTPSRILREKMTDGLSTPPVRELRISDLKTHTPVRVIKADKKENVATPTREPKQCSIFATPMRVLKHGRNREDLENKAKVLEIVKDNSNNVRSPTELTENLQNDLNMEIKLANKIEEDKEGVKMEAANGTSEDNRGVELKGPSSISGDNRQEEMKDFQRTVQGSRDIVTALSFDELEENAIWKIKPTPSKTPVKKEILTLSTVKECYKQDLFSGDTAAHNNLPEEQKSARDAIWTTRYTDSFQKTHQTQPTLQQFEWNTPDMQLPVVLNLGEKSDSSSEMPNLAGNNWNKSKTGTLLDKDLAFEKCTTSESKSQDPIGPGKSCDMSTANQNLLDRIQQHLERKLHEIEGTRSKDSGQITKGLTHSENHLNIQNNNVVVNSDSACTDNPNQTAGQLNKNFTQGIDYNTNANNTTTIDINYNIGTSDVTNSNLLAENFHGKLDNNLTNDFAYAKSSYSPEIDQTATFTNDAVMPIKLRNMDLTDKVVSPLQDSDNIDIETPRNVRNIRTVDNVRPDNTDEYCLADEVSEEAEGDKDVKMYAPTPCIERWSGVVTNPRAHSNFPLLTPLALRMMARQQKDKSSTNQIDELEQTTKEKSGTHVADTFGKHSEDFRENKVDIMDPAITVEARTPPQSKMSAFQVVSKSSITPLVGSLSLRGNVESHGKPRTKAKSRERVGSKMLISMNERYQEALLDEEVTRFASRLVADHVGYMPRCCNPVAKILMEGDDMHFLPIEADPDEMNDTCALYLPKGQKSLWQEASLVKKHAEMKTLMMKSLRTDRRMKQIKECEH